MNGTAAAVVAVLGAKGAPGATTSTLALACGWPRPVLVADADPGGGDIAAGWLAGRVGLDRSLLGFAAATRHLDAPTAADLVPHVVAVPDAPGVLVLPGLAHAGQATGLQQRVWTRLARAAATPWPTGPGPGDGSGDGPGDGVVRVDLLADCGRIGPATPWPLLAAASVVLLATRPTLRGVHHARHALTAVHAMAAVDPGRVGLLVCGPGPYEPAEVARAVGLPAPVVLPADARAARVLCDGAGSGRGWSRTVLARTARTAAHRLAATTGTAPGRWTPGPAHVGRPAAGSRR